MSKIVINGGKTLKGTISISGAKNAALPIITASILSSKPITIQNVPQLKDISTTIKLLTMLGAQITIADHKSLIVDCSFVNSNIASYDLVKTMRASILVLGPLLARFGQAVVSLPGGCAIGSRPVDVHLKGFEKMGAKIELSNGYINAKTDGKLHGALLNLDVPSVTGTENLIMGATLAEGKTIIKNAAKEPEIVDLANFLNTMGAKITGAGTDTIEIIGVSELESTEYSILPDRIEAGTYLVAAAMTRGSVLLQNVNPNTMESTIFVLRKTGAEISTSDNSIFLDMKGERPKAIDIATGPYPLFPTDMQAQVMALDTIAIGSATITENIFENRFMHVQELVRMNADLTIEKNTVIAHGKEFLNGAQVMATDLRASASLILAGLVAKGTTIVDRIYHLDRGYETMEEKLSRLGADIKRI